MQRERQNLQRCPLFLHERVWNIMNGSEDDRTTGAITATRVFFERPAVGTRLRDYEIGGAAIGTLVAKLEEHGMMTALGEHGSLTPEVARKVYQDGRITKIFQDLLRLNCGECVGVVPLAVPYERRPGHMPRCTDTCKVAADEPAFLTSDPSDGEEVL
jgi:hypothetical protein